MIGALLMVFLIGNVNVLTEMLDIDIPSRSLWQLIVGVVITLCIFINHFLLAHSNYHNMRRIMINQILLAILLLFRCYQIISNIVYGQFGFAMLELTIGLLAIIPTLNVIICAECRSDGYKA